MIEHINEIIEALNEGKDVRVKSKVEVINEEFIIRSGTHGRVMTVKETKNGYLAQVNIAPYGSGYTHVTYSEHRPYCIQDLELVLIQDRKQWTDADLRRDSF